MSDKQQTQSENGLSGYSVVLGFIGTGLLLYRWYPAGFGGVTGWVASGLMLFGGAGLMIELDGSNWSDLDFASAGVGALVMVPTIPLSRVVYENWTGPWLWVTMAVFCVLWILGIAGIANTALDVVGQVGRSIVEARTRETILELVKQLALLATAVASIVVAVRRLFS